MGLVGIGTWMGGEWARDRCSVCREVQGWRKAYAEAGAVWQVPSPPHTHHHSYPPPSPVRQEGEDYEVVPGSQFVVSRTAHRSNKSDYYIGGRKSSFAEVTELLKGKGIDLDNNRFLILQVRRGVAVGVVVWAWAGPGWRMGWRGGGLESGCCPGALQRRPGIIPCSICCQRPVHAFKSLTSVPRWHPPCLPPLQGEVEQISMMKPKGQSEHEGGLLEYLEDIIGTDKYIPALEEKART